MFKTCVLAFARDEEKQLDEWIDYHLNIGFTHIFILDNNDEDKKLIIEDNRVSVIPYHIDCHKYFLETGKNHSVIQCKAYNSVLPYIYDMGYEYVLVIDIDEFFVPKIYSNVDDFIQEQMVNTGNELCEIWWEIYDDNNIIWEKDCKSSILETYTTIQTTFPKNENRFDISTWPKSLFKLHEGVYFYDEFELDENRIINPEASGNVHWPAAEFMNGHPYHANFIDKKIAVINHYRTQCLERFINHKVLHQNFKHIYSGELMFTYFLYNILTKEKLLAFKEICAKYNVEMDAHIYNEWLQKIEKNENKVKDMENKINCLTYVTHIINKDNIKYIKYIKENLPKTMDLYVLYDISKEQNRDLLEQNDINYFSFNSDEIPNFRLDNHPKLVQPILPFIQFFNKHIYEHYLLMENDIVLDGDIHDFLIKINNSNADYIHIAQDTFFDKHWPKKYIENFDKQIYYSWCQLVYMSNDFVQFVIDNYNSTMYYEFLLPSLAYNNTDKFVINQFESYGYNFVISAEPDEEDTILAKYRTNIIPNTFFHQIKDFSNIKYRKKTEDIRCAVVCPCKLENRYIREWVEYYKGLGFKNAIIVDNNDPDGERCSDVLQDYIDEGFVIIFDYRGQQFFGKAFNDVYHAFSQNYDWMANFETDEYVYFEKFDNVNDFVNQVKFDNFDIIELFWKNYGDSGLITVENEDYSIQKRFTQVVKSGTIEDMQAKCFVRCIPNVIQIEGPHTDIVNCHHIMRRCNAEGIMLDTFYNYGATVAPRTYKEAYIKHYRTKTLQEYIEHRVVRGMPYAHQAGKTHNVNFFFLFNERTPEKEQWLKENYPYFYAQLFEPYSLEDYYRSMDAYWNDQTIDIYNY